MASKQSIWDEEEVPDWDLMPKTFLHLRVCNTLWFSNTLRMRDGICLHICNSDRKLLKYKLGQLVASFCLKPDSKVKQDKEILKQSFWDFN